ncbi:MAG: hypothetical protein K2P30_09135 [Lachnospiraceae bacterium]|nr:hypothetical protein [Lachnospiraceae bacterium]
MAVGKGSMERAAKAAGGDTAKKAGDKAQAPVRRLTISEIVGEPSYVEPPRTARPPVNKPVSGGGGVKPSPVNKAEPAVRPPVAEKPSPVNKAESAVRPPEAEKPSPVRKAEPAVRPPVAEKPLPVNKAEPVNVPEAAAAPKTVNKTEPVVKPSEVEKAAAEKPVQAAKQEPETRPSPAAGKTPAVLEKEAEGEIVYQKSSGMLERAAEPNERFGLGDAMPVYYF